MSGSWHRELEVARRIALEAGKLLLEVYATEFHVEDKPDEGGPVTLADQRANAFIVAELARAFPSDPVVAEETAEEDARRVRPARGRCWFVDPMDGTREFVDRNGMFAVQIGLAVDGEAVCGVVYAPVTRKLYAGAVDGGATLEVDGAQPPPLRVSPPPADTSGLRLLVSRSHKSKKTALIRNALGITQVAEHGSVGLKCGLVAEGVADLYLHPSPRSYRWDACGPEAIIRGAGGVLLDFAGQPYRYDGTELQNVRGLFACAREAVPAVLPVLQRVAKEAGLIPA